MKDAPVPPYGVAIQKALASGDLATMKQAAENAEQHLRTYGDVAAALRGLRERIALLEGSRRASAADAIPYGDPVRAATASGDLAEMQKMLRVGEEWLARVPDLREALEELKQRITALQRLRPE